MNFNVTTGIGLNPNYSNLIIFKAHKIRMFSCDIINNFIYKISFDKLQYLLQAATWKFVSLRLKNKKLIW